MLVASGRRTLSPQFPMFSSLLQPGAPQHSCIGTHAFLGASDAEMAVKRQSSANPMHNLAFTAVDASCFLAGTPLLPCRPRHGRVFLSVEAETDVPH